MAPPKIEKELPAQVKKLIENGRPPLVPRKDDATLEKEGMELLQKNHIPTSGN